MSRRYQLTDAQWGLIEPQFPSRSLIGRPTREPRQVLDGILWILHTGLLGETFQNVSDHGIRSTTPSGVGRMQAGLMPFWKRCNSSSMKKGSSISTCGAWTAPMSEHPKMLPVHVKNTSMNQALGRSRGRFRQQNSLGHGRSRLTTELLPVTGAISRNQLCNKRVGHGEDTNVIRSLPNTASASCRRQGL